MTYIPSLTNPTVLRSAFEIVFLPLSLHLRPSTGRWRARRNQTIQNTKKIDTRQDYKEIRTTATAMKEIDGNAYISCHNCLSGVLRSTECSCVCSLADKSSWVTNTPPAKTRYLISSSKYILSSCQYWLRKSDDESLLPSLEALRIYTFASLGRWVSSFTSKYLTRPGTKVQAERALKE